MDRVQKIAEADKAALESGKISLNALREKYGLPAIKDGLAEQCLAKSDGVVCDGSIGFSDVFRQNHGSNFHSNVRG